MEAAKVSRNQELVGGRSGATKHGGSGATEHGGGEQSEDQTFKGGGDTTHGEQEEDMDGEAQQSYHSPYAWVLSMHSSPPEPSCSDRRK